MGGDTYLSLGVDTMKNGCVVPFGPGAEQGARGMEQFAHRNPQTRFLAKFTAQRLLDALARFDATAGIFPAENLADVFGRDEDTGIADKDTVNPQVFSWRFQARMLRRWGNIAPTAYAFRSRVIKPVALVGRRRPPVRKLAEPALSPSRPPMSATSRGWPGGGEGRDRRKKCADAHFRTGDQEQREAANFFANDFIAPDSASDFRRRDGSKRVTRRLDSV